MNRRNNKRPALQKEKISIIAASVFVLSALTLAGVYMSSQGGMSSRDDKQKQENRIDFAKLEQDNVTSDEGNAGVEDTRFVSGKAESEGSSDKKAQIDNRFVDPEVYDLSDNNDMDVDPAFTEANSGQVENTRQDGDTAGGVAAGTDKAAVFMEGQDPGQETAIIAETPLNFTEEDGLALPVIGDVLLDYSMDKAVYHSTMQQYRYNPALVVAANEGQDITAAADGIVSDVYYDSQTGNTIRFDLGNGYMLTYGQLDEINLQPGDRVSVGDIVGKVAKPTIYYTEEGTNIYYKLTKDGEPVDPLHRPTDTDQ